uniref:START domain-containing protein n=1 Tax=Globisporangium ultimum (strain ATCC 200006 / CBS 805.95 / DAOM BR144) TaxID=431595 RepID=K3W8U6_GLOUD
MLTWDPNKARKEHKAELISLRKMVVDLETQVAELKTNNRIWIGNSVSQRPRASISSRLITLSSRSQQQNTNSRTTQNQQLKFTIPVHVTSWSPEMYAWQKIAKRQSIARTKSERENIRLKLTLENQLKVALDLERRFIRAAATAELEKCTIQDYNSPAGNCCPCKAKACTTTEVFNDLLAGVEQCYAEVDSVFASSGLACSVLASMVSKMRPDCDRRLFLEVCSTKALPFDMHTTASAVWNHYVHTKERIPFRHYSYKTPKSTDLAEDTVVENFNLSVEINKKLAKFCIKQITRRYVEATRVVIVWCSTFAPIEFSCESLSGVRFLEKGYVVVTHPSLRPDGLTLLQTCYVVKPLSDGDGLDSDNPHLTAITDFLMSSKELNILVSDQMIESELLQHSLRSIADVA